LGHIALHNDDPAGTVAGRPHAETIMRRPSSQPVWHNGPVRVRREEPAIEEAIAAAMDLSEDPGEIAALAAGLMGVSEDEIRPLIAKVSKAKANAGPIRRDGSPVVVVSRTRRPLAGHAPVTSSVLRQGLLPRSR
jgi:hypothetical protein